jgi:hypothetical protein
LEILEAKEAAHQDALKELSAMEITHQKALDALKATHTKELEAHDRAIIAREADHATEIELLQESHAKAIASLKKEHAASQESLSSVAEKSKVSDLRVLFFQVQLLITELGSGRGTSRRDHQDKRRPQKDAGGT